MMSQGCDEIKTGGLRFPYSQ